jgi:signal transduction histidine kinase
MAGLLQTLLGAARMDTLSAPRRAGLFLAGASLLAVVMSTQFLTQPFVWQNFDGDQILQGWWLVFRARLLVTACIAATVFAAGWLPTARTDRDFTAEFAAIVIGALLGELALAGLDPDANRNDAMGISGRVLLWSVSVGAAFAMYWLWQRGEAAAAVHHATELRLLRAERLLRRLRIESLQRQIEPHFLFNTLATIRRLQRSSPADGQKLLSRFCEFLHSSLDVRADINSQLGNELAIATAYLDICALRMDGMLTWQMDVAQELRPMSFPRYGLATLLENAVKHGIAPAARGGNITIAARVDDALLVVSVIDTGVGFSGEHGHGLGLANIREQLQLRYGGAASLTLTANHPRGVSAVVKVPLEKAA